MKSSLESALKLVENLENLLELQDDQEGLSWYNRRTLVLARVLEEGGTVSTERWKKIGAEFGYDGRGLGGFFTGNTPSMVTIAGNNKAITTAGEQSVRDWVIAYPDVAEAHKVNID